LRFSGLILENIFMVFLGSSCRETAKKRDKKNRWEKTKAGAAGDFPTDFFRPETRPEA
jgi:hypothetical protein